MHARMHGGTHANKHAYKNDVASLLSYIVEALPFGNVTSAYAHIYIYIYVCIYIYIYIYMRARVHAHRCMHARRYARKHAYKWYARQHA